MAMCTYRGERIEEIGALATVDGRIDISTGSMHYANGRTAGKDEPVAQAARTDLSTKNRKKFETAELHSPIAGTLCSPLCRSRRLQRLYSYSRI